jgi:hypothetical protein
MEHDGTERNMDRKDYRLFVHLEHDEVSMILEGDSSEPVIAGLPPEWRPGRRAVPAEVFELPG